MTDVLDLQVLAKVMGKSSGSSSTAGFAEVYESAVLWTIPPRVTCLGVRIQLRKEVEHHQVHWLPLAKVSPHASGLLPVDIGHLD